MKKGKKKSSSLKNEEQIKIALLLFIILFLIVVVLITAINIHKKESKQEEIKYFTGNLYSANRAANMIDYIDTSSNKLISPLNIDTSLAILYNGTDNNSTKELKSYFKKSYKDINSDMKEKMASLNKASSTDEKFKQIYENYIKELENNYYHELTIQKISNFNPEDKSKLQLLLKKITLSYERMTYQNELTEKNISNYVISEKNLISNEYTLKSMLDDVLYNYELYKISNRVTNYNELFTNNKLNDKNINKEYLDNIEDYNFNINSIDFSSSKEAINTINSKIKEISLNEINRIVEEKDLTNNDYIMINSLNFNYEWNTPIKSSYVLSKEFYNYNNKVSVVDMMYIKEKDTIYLENDYATGFIKDFKNKDYSFIGILPKKYDDVLISSLDLESLLQSKKQDSVLVGIPKFTIQYELDITELLKNYNIHELFTNKSNFSKISDEKINLKKNIQKVNIIIDEKGTVENNISLKNMENIEIEESKKEVILNRPFAFLIINNYTNDIIFIGKVNEI